MKKPSDFRTQEQMRRFLEAYRKAAPWDGSEETVPDAYDHAILNSIGLREVFVATVGDAKAAKCFPLELHDHTVAQRKRLHELMAENNKLRESVRQLEQLYCREEDEEYRREA